MFGRKGLLSFPCFEKREEKGLQRIASCGEFNQLLQVKGRTREAQIWFWRSELERDFSELENEENLFGNYLLFLAPKKRGKKKRDV